jgi:hypothetical protein
MEILIRGAGDIEKRMLLRGGRVEIKIRGDPSRT